jgi:hypothetical protein
MPKHSNPLRLEEGLVNRATVVAGIMNRSVNEQVEFWASVGMQLTGKLDNNEITQLLSGHCDVAITPKAPPKLDIDDLINEVATESENGKLTQAILSAGVTRYQPSPARKGFLQAIHPDGSREDGEIVKGKFFACAK